jgi:predicted nucleic acid-binding Zn ribbon protein
MKFICSECGQPVDSKRRARFCSSECATNYGRRRAREAYQARVKTCTNCAGPIPPEAGRSLFCDDACRAEHAESRRDRELAMATPPTHAAECECGTCLSCNLTIAMAADARDFASRRNGGDMP